MYRQLSSVHTRTGGRTCSGTDTREDWVNVRYAFHDRESLIRAGDHKAPVSLDERERGKRSGKG